MTQRRQQFTQGMGMEDLSASAMNNLTERVEGHDAIAVQAPLTIHKGDRQYIIGINLPRGQAVIQEQTVVVTAVGTHTLTVKPIRYKADPPKQCPTMNPPADCGIEVLEQEIEAYPDFGLKPADFTSLIHVPPVSDATQYVKLYWQGTWLAKIPGGGGGAARFVKVESVPDPARRVVSVVFQKWNDDQTELIADGDPVDVFTWPDRTGADFTWFVGRTDVLRAEMLEGGWYVIWKGRFVPRPVPDGAILGACT